MLQLTTQAHWHEPPDNGYWKIARSKAAIVRNATSRWRASLMVDLKKFRLSWMFDRILLAQDRH